MVDARDLKSLGTLYRASSSLAPGTRDKKKLKALGFQLFLFIIIVNSANYPSIAIFFALAFSLLGKVIVKTPFLYFALILLSSTSEGKGIAL